MGCRQESVTAIKVFDEKLIFQKLPEFDAAFVHGCRQFSLKLALSCVPEAPYEAEGEPHTR